METLKVIIRVRPLNKKELEANHHSVWDIDCENNCLSSTSQTIRRYSFDRVYSISHSTKDIYNESMSPVITSFVNGFNGTIFAYGQTSSGKTYTMMGSGGHKDDGVIHRAIKYIFRTIQQMRDREFVLKVSYLEIYNESIKDLLAPNNVDLKISMDNFHRPVVRGLTTECIRDQQQLFHILKQGMSNRNVGATKMNAQSSRSHTIFQILLESRQVESCAEFDGSVRCSVLNIVDLAGSERQKKTDSSGQRLKEGGHINKSLLTLGIVIQKLSDISRGKGTGGHIPYRDSKLTHILEPALGGNSKTVVICTVTPADVHQEETISTLGFASRAKEVTNNARVEEIIDEAAIIKRQKKQIAELQRQLNQYKNGNISTNNDSNNGIVNANTCIANDATATQIAGYERTIVRLKALCKQPQLNECKHSDDEDIDLIKTGNEIQHVALNDTKKKKSVLGKRRRHSVAIDCDGTPARKRLKTQLAQNQPRTRHSSFATPLNKARIQNEQYEWKLRKATHISKGLQQELNAKYRDFNEMQMEIDRLNEINSIQSQKIEFFESSISDDTEKNHVMEKQRLTLQMNELKHIIEGLKGKLTKYEEGQVTQEKREMECKLRRELEHSHCTIDELQSQIAELRLNIEQQQKLTESIAKEPREMSLDAVVDASQTNVLFQMNLSKLQSQLILIKNDKAKLQQMLTNEAQEWISFRKECVRQFEARGAAVLGKMATLERELEECNDEKRLFESQYHQIREERDEMRVELSHLRRPENEIMNELESELLNMQKQSDIDSAHTLSIQNGLEEKVNEIDDLRTMNCELREMMQRRENSINNEWNVKMGAMKQELNDAQKLNDQMTSREMKWTTHSNKQIDAMNASQARETLRTMKRTLREQQSKMSAIERKRDAHEKTASKYNKRRGELEQRLKKVSREAAQCKSQLLSIQKLNRRLKTKNDKLQMTVKKLTNDAVNEKDVHRKLKMMNKRFEATSKKYEAKCAECNELKRITQQNEVQMNASHDEVKKMKNESHKMKNECDKLRRELSTEKDVVAMLQSELKKFHQMNGQQGEELARVKMEMADDSRMKSKLEENLAFSQSECERMAGEVASLKSELERVKMELDDAAEEAQRLREQNECQGVNLSAMKETDCIQRNEIDETNKLLRESQRELNYNKRELNEYQNRWTKEKRANDSAIEKLRRFELERNTLLHDAQLALCSVESKTKEIERLNGHAVEQQEALLRVTGECADYSTQCESQRHELQQMAEEAQLVAADKARWMRDKEDCAKKMNQMMMNSVRHAQQLECAKKELSDATQQMAQQQIKYCTQHKLRQEWESKYRVQNQQMTQYEEKMTRHEEEMNDAIASLSSLKRKWTQTKQELGDALQQLLAKGDTDKQHAQMKQQMQQLLAKYSLQQEELAKLRELRTAQDKLRQTMLENEALREDNSAMKKFEHKYAQAKEYMKKCAAQCDKLKKREAKYENAIQKWKEWEEQINAKLHKQKQQIENLKPTKAKARKFEELCKEYHYAKTNIFKANCICRETQTNECRLPNRNNNILTTSTTTNTE